LCEKNGNFIEHGNGAMLVHYTSVAIVKEEQVITFNYGDTASASELEALPVHDGGSALVILLLSDPHLLEGRQ